MTGGDWTLVTRRTGKRGHSSASTHEEDVHQPEHEDLEPAAAKRKREDDDSAKGSERPTQGTETATVDLDDAARAREEDAGRTTKKQKLDPARVPKNASLDGPVVHPDARADARDIARQLREARNPLPTPAIQSTPAPPAASNSAPDGHANTAGPPPTPPPIQGTSLLFTAPPEGGFRPPQGSQAGWEFNGVHDDQADLWNRITSGRTFAIPYSHSVADRTLNRQSFQHPIRPFDAVAKTVAADFLLSDASLLHCSTPFLDHASGRPGQAPYAAVLHGLTAEQEAALLDIVCLAADGGEAYGAIIFLPVGINIPSHMCTIGDLPSEPINDIRDMAMGVIEGDVPRAQMAAIMRTMPEAEGIDDEVLSQIVINNLSIEVLDAHTVGGIPDPALNLYLKPLSNSVTMYNSFKKLFQGLKYRKSLFGEARVIVLSPCHGCHGTDHFSGMCTYPRTPGWRGPQARAQALSQRSSRGGYSGRGGRGGRPPRTSSSSFSLSSRRM